MQIELPINGKKIKISFLFILIPMILFFMYLFRCMPERWTKDVAFISELSESPLLINVKHPSSLYGRKYIVLDTSMLENQVLKTRVKIGVINLNNNEIGVISKSFFSGDIEHDQEAIIFSGTLLELRNFYRDSTINEIPQIIHRSKDKNIAIRISSQNKVSFEKLLRLYMFADRELS